ncbi:hypothetical protein DYH09_02940 [bacterium CPR1]|nr:hypothetical protein [bacterium CPR1]
MLHRRIATVVTLGVDPRWGVVDGLEKLPVGPQVIGRSPRRLVKVHHQPWLTPAVENLVPFRQHRAPRQAPGHRQAPEVGTLQRLILVLAETSVEAGLVGVHHAPPEMADFSIVTPGIRMGQLIQVRQLGPGHRAGEQEEREQRGEDQASHVTSLSNQQVLQSRRARKLSWEPFTATGGCLLQ